MDRVLTTTDEPEFRTEILPGMPAGVRYSLLPRFNSRAVRTWLTVCAFAGVLYLLRHTSLGVFRLQLALVAGGMVFIWSGRGPLGWRGTCVIELIEGRFTCTEYVGPFRWRHSVSADQIKQFVIGDNNVLRKDFSTRFLLGIRVDTTRGSWWMALGYRRAMLEALLEHLAPRCGSVVHAAARPGIRPIEVRNYPDHDPLGLTYDRLERPAESEVILDRHARAVEIYVPPMGFWKSPTGLSSLVVGALVAVLASIVGVQPEETFLVSFAILGFGAVAVFHFVRAVRTGCTATSLMATNERLVICWRGPLGSRVLELPQDKVVAIRLANARIRGGKRTDYMQLWIAVENQKPVTLLKARDPDELRWIATTLRARLCVPAIEFV